jgi:hypothetical protein
MERRRKLMITELKRFSSSGYRSKVDCDYMPSDIMPCEQMKSVKEKRYPQFLARSVQES